ncbi:MAG: hypothetical protein ACLGIK_11940, partial [Gemmatimonadota bacterium]
LFSSMSGDAFVHGPRRGAAPVAPAPPSPPTPPAPPAPPTKSCKFCLSTIPEAATRCAHCTSQL